MDPLIVFGCEYASLDAFFADGVQLWGWAIDPLVMEVLLWLRQ